jgi:S-formylglutathione hydrolase
MGGACALMQALRHPHLFSVAVSHAGAFAGPLRDGDPYAHLRSESGFLMPSTEVHERVWGPQGSVTRCAYDPFRMLLSWPAETTLRVYADVGTGDYQRIITMNRDMVTALRAAKFETEYQERDGAHDLDFVDRMLPFSLGFVLDHLKAS